MSGTGGSSILDLEVLEKGGSVPKDDDPSFQAGYPVQNTMASDPTLLAQAVNPAVYPVPNAMVSVPMVQTVTPVENRTQETYQAAKQYDFWEENQNYEIHVCIHKKAHTNNAKSNYYTSGDDKIKHKEIIIANFLVDSITKVITEGLVQETVEFVIKCSYYDDAERQEQTIEISVDEETFSGTYLVQAFRTAFGSKHTPFPPKNNPDLDLLLSKYLLDRYHEYPKELRRTPMPELNGVRDLSESEKKSIAKWFRKLYDPYNCGMELLLATTFGAICRDKLESLDARILPAMTKTLVVYGCNSNEQRNMIAALLSTTSDGITKQKLSEIKVTSSHDELKPLIFEYQYQPLVLIDDTISDYAKKQNIAIVNDRINTILNNQNTHISGG